jgi:hypothetical protein
MINKPLLNNNSERLREFRANIGYSEFIVTFAKRLTTESSDISKTVNAMQGVIMSGRVKNWAKRSNIINQTGGVVTSLSKDELKQAYESESMVSGMSSELPDELGGLRVFSPINNDRFLNEILDDEQKLSEKELTGQELMASEARHMIETIPMSSISIEELTNLSDDQFTVAI